MTDIIYRPTEEDFREAIENVERLLSARNLLNETIDKLGGLTTDAKVTRHCKDARDRIKFELWSALKDVWNSPVETSWSTEIPEEIRKLLAEHSRSWELNPI